MRYLWVWLKIQWIRVFCTKQDTSCIPVGLYCYTIDHEKNNSNPLPNGYWTKPCKYYHNLGNGNTACSYVGFIGFDVAHSDQCKICGENYETNNTEHETNT